MIYIYHILYISYIIHMNRSFYHMVGKLKLQLAASLCWEYVFFGSASLLPSTRQLYILLSNSCLYWLVKNRTFGSWIIVIPN